MVMTRLALFPVLSHSRDGLRTQFIKLATFQRSIQLSALSLLRTRRTFNFICSSTPRGFFLFSGHCPAQCVWLWRAILPSHLQGLLLLRFRRRGKSLILDPIHRDVFACKPTRIILWIFTEIPDPDVEFTCGYRGCFEMLWERQTVQMCMQQGDSVDAACKRGWSFSL